MQCIASDDESSYDESSSDDDSDNTAPSSAKSRCNHPGCTKNKQHNCFGYCQAHVKLYNDPIAAAALHALSSSEEEEEDDEPSPNAYAGVSWDKVAKKYKSRISIPQNMRMAHKNKRVVYLGSYALAADAALAHDEGARLLKLPSKANFATIKDYEKAKRAVGGTNDGMSSAEILSKVKDVVSKIQPKSNIGDEELSDDDGSDEEMSVASDRSGPSAAIKREERIAPDVTFAKSRSNKGGTNEHSRRIFLKPLFEVGDAVQACWWPDEKSRRANSASAWYPGTVRSYKEKKTSSPYGPTRTYDIHYDDDDELDGVEEQYVWSREDYVLNEKNLNYMSKKRNKGKSSWIGVKNATDKKSTDSWAKIVGWYVATIDGQEQKFSHISGKCGGFASFAKKNWNALSTLLCLSITDAMDAYDNHIVKLKGKRTKKSDLNRPEQWGWLFENADDSDGGIAQERNDSRIPSPPAEFPPSKRQKLAIPSIYENVSYSKRDKKYLAQVVCDGKLHCLGESSLVLIFNSTALATLTMITRSFL